MKKVWAVELDMVDEFTRYCAQQGIRCYAICGTLLGAIRHQGFIPWDDDIDLAVPRADFDRLCREAPGYFREPYFFQAEQTDPGFSRPFARLRNTQTTAIPEYDLDSALKFNQGIWIDIFPLDNIPDDPAERAEWIHALTKLHRSIWSFSRMTTRYRTPLNNENAIKKLRRIPGPFLKGLCEHYHIANPYVRRYEELSRRYINAETKEWGLLWFYKKNEWSFWDRELFYETEKKPFENLSLPVPKEHEAILTKAYGDWRIPVQGGAAHYGTLYDVESPYTRYIKAPDELRERMRIINNQGGNPCKTADA